MFFTEIKKKYMHIPYEQTAYNRGRNLEDLGRWMEEEKVPEEKREKVERAYIEGFLDAQTAAGGIIPVERRCTFLIDEDGTAFERMKESYSKKNVYVYDDPEDRYFRGVNADTNVILINNVPCYGIAEISGNEAVLIREKELRGRIWKGRDIMVVSPMSLEEWLKSCGCSSDDRVGSGEIKGEKLKDRFWECRLAR